MDNSILIKEAKNGSAAAQKCLFDLFADRMFIVCRRYLRSREDAEEIMTDGFLKFFSKLKGFNYQNDAALYAWLKKIMVNECLGLLRKKSSFIIVAESEAENNAAADDCLAGLAAADLFALITQLPVGYRTVFNLFAAEGYEHREIAAILSITEGTSKSQLSKARALLQKMLLQNGIQYEPARTK